jgi:hypothetical protein
MSNLFTLYRSIIHFAAFVIACYETNVRNRRNHTTTVVVQQYPSTTTSPLHSQHTGLPTSTHHSVEQQNQTKPQYEMQPVASHQLHC